MVGCLGDVRNSADEGDPFGKAPELIGLHNRASPARPSIETPQLTLDRNVRQELGHVLIPFEWLRLIRKRKR